MTCGCSRSTALPESKSRISSQNISDDFHWSFDGSKMAVIRGHTDSDVVLIRDMQP